MSNKVLMDEKGILQLKQEIADLERKLNTQFVVEGNDRTDRYNTGFEVVLRERTNLSEMLRLKREQLANSQIIEKGVDLEVIDLDDVVDVTFVANGRNLVFKLVGRDGDFSKEIPEISINSPMGSSVYKKRVGDTFSYSVGSAIHIVLINSKLELSCNINPLERK